MASNTEETPIAPNPRNNHNTDIPTRAIIVALKSPFGGKSSIQISEITGVSPRTVNSIYTRAISRGFEPNAATLKVLPEHLVDVPRSGRPRKQDDLDEATIEAVRKDSQGRQKSYADIAADLSLYGYNVSASTVWRVLKASAAKKTKRTRKPGLTTRIRNPSTQEQPIIPTNSETTTE
ncbi:Transposable element Tcb2 transposase [Pyrenophora seminiperda CCB06]|uniref:Transposable element Tcb2 transposase n=1 Tax=Pyrenophora seminiperda CCB06 TaxID=1302712 RepID=A0A3M7M8H5_9PLEO|nr:Transposable element Tcb2 transposase [Pyrenophora seminiperda CCB06]